MLELELSLGHRFTNVQLEEDSMSTIFAILNERRGFSPIFLLFMIALSLLNTVFVFLNVIMFVVVVTVAHLVASWEATDANERVHMEPFSQGILA